MQAKYDYETERLKEIIRQRETERERLWIQNREDNSYRPPDNLFHQASQLSSILDVEERKIQEQWNKTTYGWDSEYQRAGPSGSRRKNPEVIVHCAKKERL
ncbi:unnamed protein product [Acanthoscelides obtectus]|nr:unnamed protein product [Acanthoscelides obtectus]CAK1654176.1 hypothetical protein AOBTE_LOCUS18467 [Acanthoscelides obtectus]